MAIGAHFVMDPKDAFYAMRDWLKPKFVIPMHYGTTPVLKGTPQEYMAALGQTTTKVFPSFSRSMASRGQKLRRIRRP
jgi:L-ascorbate metabolism protein UlaG (beta-lactamase superfamily)